MSEPAGHASAATLEAGLDHVRGAPRDVGVVELIVRRPAVGEREILGEGELDLALGLVGDRWGSPPDGRTHNPETQLTLMGARAIDLIAGDRARWALAGDQLYVDLDLSVENLPPGTRLALGTAVVEVTAEPHTGCAKFRERFGSDALRLVNQPEGRELRLRGLNARVLEPGRVRTGDPIRRVVSPEG